MPSNEDGSWWIGFGAQVRVRVEGWSDFNLGAPKTADHDDVALHHGLFAHADLHLGEHLRLFVEGKNAEAAAAHRSMGRSRPGAISGCSFPEIG